MVNSPRWVMYQDKLMEVVKHKGNMVWLNFGWYHSWTDVRNFNFGHDKARPNHMAVLLKDCQPITDEVAQIMRSV